MPAPLVWTLAAAAAWALLGLGFAALRTLRSSWPSFAAPRGAGMPGLIYSFTGAMAPARKESVSRHPAAFVLGLALHAGVAGSFVALGAAAVAPDALTSLAPALLVLALVGLAGGLALLVKRIASAEMRAVSVADDFVAAALVALFLADAALWLAQLVPAAGFAAMGALLLFYAPLGKLRHMAFFFVARGDAGWRLGLRGVYPPAGRAGGADVVR